MWNHITEINLFIKQIFTCKTLTGERRLDQNEMAIVQKKHRPSVETMVEEKLPDENGVATQSLIPKTLTFVWSLCNVFPC